MTFINGLPTFFEYMNAHYRHWVLVGGCAAWMHIARAPRNKEESTEIYNLIFPEDIEVVIIGNPIDPAVTVMVGTRRPLNVEFLHNHTDATTLSHWEIATIIDGACVLPIEMIITRYNISTSDPAKMGKRMARVYMLRELQDHRSISPNQAMQQYEHPPKHSPMALAAAAMQAKRLARESSQH